MSDTESIFDLEKVSTDTLCMLSADTLSLITSSTKRYTTFPIWYELHRLIESHIDKRIATESQEEDIKQ